MASIKEPTRADSVRPAADIHRLYLVFRQRLVYLRLTPFDTSTEQGRFGERYRRAALTVVTSGVSKAMALLATLVSVPLTVGYLGTERFGLWMTISSVVTVVVGFADLGLGSGLQNAISRAQGKGDVEAGKKAISSTFCVLLAMTVALLGVFRLLYPYVPWARVFNVVSPTAVREAGPAAAALLCCYALLIPLGVAYRVQMGLQEGYVAYVWEAAGNLLSLAGILLAVHLNGGLLPLVLAVAGGPLVAGLFNSMVFFGRLHPSLRPRWNSIHWATGMGLVREGLLFLFTQVAVYGLWAAPVFVTANRLGASAVSVFSTAYKVLAIPATLCMMFWTPLWPAYAEAYSRQDYAWVGSTFRRTRNAAILFLVPVMFILACVTPAVVRLWTRGQIEAPFGLAFTIALMVFSTAMRSLHFIPLVACGRVRTAAMIMPVAGVLAYLLTVFPFIQVSAAAVPLWAAGCEVVILVFFLLDTRDVMSRLQRGRPLAQAGWAVPLD